MQSINRKYITNQLWMFGFPNIILIIIVIGLFIMAVAASIKFNKPSRSLNQLKSTLGLLLERLQQKGILDVRNARKEMEIAFNYSKINNTAVTISNDTTLRSLVQKNCDLVKTSLTKNTITTTERINWLQLSSLLTEFNELYFIKSKNQTAKLIG